MLPSRAAATPPLAYRPQATRTGIVQPKMAGDAPQRPTPPLPYRPQPVARAIQPSRMLQGMGAHAVQRHVHHGAAPGVTGRAVIQCWRCRECDREITYSDDHLPSCRSYYLRTYETRDDQEANYYDRPRGGVRTRSGSVERQYRDGTDERRHFHENRYNSTGYVEHSRGYWDRNGRYHPG